MEAVSFDSPGFVRLADVADPEPPAGWARVRVRCAAITGIDRALFEGNQGARFPMIAGSSWCGEVDRVGPNTDASWVGRKVVADSEVTCLRCRFCRRGEWRRCPQYRRIGVEFPGGFAEYVMAPVHNLHAPGDSVSFDQAALLGPLAAGLAVVDTAGVRVADTAAVLGTGPLGLNVVAALKASGARRILCLDRIPERLLFARRWGAHEIFGEANSLKENAAHYHPDGTDVVVEASGDPELLRLALMLARPGGTVVLAGLAAGKQVPVAPDVIADRNLRVLGGIHNGGYMSAAVQAVGDGVMRTEEMITHWHLLHDWESAFGQAREADKSYIQGVFSL